MLQWVTRCVAKRCRKLKQKNKQTESVPEKSDEEMLNHTYEEIPDVIPANWRGVRSDSVPSFFLIATEDHSFVSENIEDGNTLIFSLNLSTSDQSYETPQNCLGHRIEDMRLEDTNLNMVDIYNESHSHDLPELYNTIDTVECDRDRLSCVRVSCHHNHSSSLMNTARGEESKLTQKLDRGDNCEEELPYYSVLEPNWEKFCDDLVSALVSKSSSFKHFTNRCQKHHNGVYSNSSKGNILPGDLLQTNYDRVY